MGFLGLLLALLIASLVIMAHPAPPPTEEEAVGTYHLDSPVGAATLYLNTNGSWEYILEKSEGAFRKTGHWKHVPSADSESTLAINLEEFELGFRRYPNERFAGPSNWFLNLEGKKEIRSCLNKTSLCFVKQKS